MTDRIEPALTPEEWVDASGSEYSEATVHLGGSVMAWFDAGDLLIEANGDGDKVHRPEVLIALANAALPDSDPRKITRAMVEDIRHAAAEVALYHPQLDRLASALSHHADALKSYLPPE